MMRGIEEAWGAKAAKAAKVPDPTPAQAQAQAQASAPARAPTTSKNSASNANHPADTASGKAYGKRAEFAINKPYFHVGQNTGCCYVVLHFGRLCQNRGRGNGQCNLAHFVDDLDNAQHEALSRILGIHKRTFLSFWKDQEEKAKAKDATYHQKKHLASITRGNNLIIGRGTKHSKRGEAADATLPSTQSRVIRDMANEQDRGRSAGSSSIDDSDKPRLPEHVREGHPGWVPPEDRPKPPPERPSGV
jgi:hypothetical protein